MSDIIGASALNKEIEELHMISQQGKKEENKIEEFETIKQKNNELSKWHDYVDEDIDNIILRMEKIEDDVNMSIGSKSELLEETRNLVKYMRQTLYKYYPEKEGEKNVEDDLSLQDIKKQMKMIKDQLRETSSGGSTYLKLVKAL